MDKFIWEKRPLQLNLGRDVEERGSATLVRRSSGAKFPLVKNLMLVWGADLPIFLQIAHS